MNKILEVKKILKQLNYFDKELIILDMLIEKEIDFISINNLYVKYLEKEKDKSNKKESLFANCLSAYISKLANKNLPFFQSQAFVLVEKWMPIDWSDRYLNNRNDKDIENNKKFLK